MEDLVQNLTRVFTPAYTGATSQPSSIFLSRLKSFKVLSASPQTKEKPTEAGSQEEEAWAVEKGTQVVGVLLACGFYFFFFFLRRCNVILFYFLALQAAGRMTWLPGKPLGKCRGLLPTSGHQNHGCQRGSHCLQPCQARVEGAETAASQASAPTVPR